MGFIRTMKWKSTAVYRFERVLFTLTYNLFHSIMGRSSPTPPHPLPCLTLDSAREYVQCAVHAADSNEQTLQNNMCKIAVIVHT